MRRCTPELKPVALAALGALSLLSAAPAAWSATTVTFMQAKGDYSIDAGTPVSQEKTYTPANGDNFLDVIDFPNSATSSAVLHSYGGVDGLFGSGSWGTGLFDVTGSFRIDLDIFNTTGTAQNVAFNFHITPGSLSTTPVAFTGSKFVETGIRFNIDKTVVGSATTSVFNSVGVLRSDASGTSFTNTGTDIFTGPPTGNYQIIEGSSFNLDLGVLNAGQAMQVSYVIDSYAKGDAIVNEGVLVPKQIVHVPEQWVDFCSGSGYGQVATLAVYGGPVDGGSDPIGGGCGSSVIEAHDVIIPEHTTSPETGGAQGRSGDPFDVLQSGAVAYQDGFTSYPLSPVGGGAPITVTFTAAVPEPGTYGLMALGLLAVGLRARRQR